MRFRRQAQAMSESNFKPARYFHNYERSGRYGTPTNMPNYDENARFLDSQNLKRFDCPEDDCGYKNELGFSHWDQLIEHRRKIHLKDIQQNTQVTNVNHIVTSKKDTEYPEKQTQAGIIMKKLENMPNNICLDVPLVQSREYMRRHTSTEFTDLRGISNTFIDAKVPAGMLSDEDTMTETAGGELSTTTSSELCAVTSSGCFSSALQPPNIDLTQFLSQPKKRILWQCQCGHTSYDDFHEIRAGAVKEYECMLQHRTNTRSSHNTNTHGIGSVLQKIPGWNRLSLYMTGATKAQTPSLPYYQLEHSSMSQPQQPNLDAEMLYLLLCLPHQKFATKLLQLDLSKVASDQHLFTLLRVTHSQMRGRLKAFLSLKSL